MSQPTEDTIHPGCDGSGECPAPAHVHGCDNDLLGHCDNPDDHKDLGVTDAVAASISEALGWEKPGHTTLATSHLAVESVNELMSRPGEEER